MFRKRQTQTLFLFLMFMTMRDACQAQYTMQMSVYTDATISEDGLTLYSAESAIDQGTCSNHYNYTITAQINAPDGRTASYTSTGLYANTSIAINDVEGDYTLVGTGRYNCGCTYGVQYGYGSSLSANLEKIIAYYRNDGPYLGAYVFHRCNPYNNRCDTLISSSATAFAKLTVWRIQTPLFYGCRAKDEQAVNGCQTPDPKP